MARQMTDVNIKRLQAIIDEEETKFDSKLGQMKFFQHCADLYNTSRVIDIYTGRDHTKDLTASVIYLRYKNPKSEQDRITTNVKGTRGKHLAGKKLSADHKEALKKRKRSRPFSRADELKSSWMNVEFPDLVEKVISTGSTKDRIKLKCLNCSNGVTAEVADCRQFDCALYDIRPYRRIKGEIKQ